MGFFIRGSEYLKSYVRPGGRKTEAAGRRMLFFKNFSPQIHWYEFFLRSRIFLDAFFGFPMCSCEPLIFFRFLEFFYIFLRPARPKNAKTLKNFFVSGRKTEYTGSDISMS